MAPAEASDCKMLVHSQCDHPETAQGKQTPLEASSCAESLAAKFQAAGMTKVQLALDLRHEKKS